MLPTPTLITVTTMDGVREMFARFHGADRISFDTETTIARPLSRKLVGMSFAVVDADGGAAYYLPVGHNTKAQRGLFDPTTANLPVGEVVEALEAFVRAWCGRAFIHNAVFDLMMCHLYRLEWCDWTTEVYDTMIAVAALGDHRNKGLAKQSKIRYGYDMKKLKRIMVDEGVRCVSEIPIDVMAVYACNDAWWTLMLGNDTTGELEKKGLWKIFWDLEMEVVPAVLGMLKTGIKLDTDLINRFDGEVALKVGGIEREWLKRWPGCNISSPQSVSKFMFIGPQALWQPVGEMGGNGCYSTDESALVRQKRFAKSKEGREAAALLLEHRKLSTLRNRYTTPLVILVDSDGRIRPSQNQVGTETGRFSSSDPNGQNMPRVDFVKSWPGDYGSSPPIRSAFIAEDGFELVDVDYCLAPSTRVLTTDLRWVAVTNVHVGDELIGFPEDLSLGRAGKFRGTRVERKKVVRQQCYRVDTEWGSIVCSARHRWVRGKKASHQCAMPRAWVETKDLVAGDELSTFAKPWDELSSPDAGYLAGFMDGEGYCGGSKEGKAGTLGFGQLPGPVLNHVLALVKKLGFSCKCASGSQEVQKYWFNGQKEGVRFLGAIRPIRLLPKARKYLWEGQSLWGKATRRVKVLRVVPIGELDTIALQTGTGTFVAEGLLSHNSQIELRMMAHLSKDPVMLEVYRKQCECVGGGYWEPGPYRLIVGEPGCPHCEGTGFSGDIHQTTADAAGCSRQDAKAVNFGLIYGQSANSLALQIGVSKSKGKKFWEAYFDTYKGVQRFHRRCTRLVKERGYVKTITGRIRYLPDIRSDDRWIRMGEERKAWNTSCQGAAADLIKIALRNLDRRWRGDGVLGTRCRMMLMVHDELLCEIRAEDVEEQKVVIKESMESVASLNVPLLAAPKAAPNWAEAH